MRCMARRIRVAQLRQQVAAQTRPITNLFSPSANNSGSSVGVDAAAHPNRRRHEERRLLKYSSSQLYAVVADVARYKEFVPWCQDSVVRRVSRLPATLPSGAGAAVSAGSAPPTGTPEDSEMVADLTVGFELFKETYTSHVLLRPGVSYKSSSGLGGAASTVSSIVATSQDTKLFDMLRTEWKFQAASSGDACWVTFRVEFQFKSLIYSQVSDLFMREVVNNMVRAFEGRCRAVYKR